MEKEKGAMAEDEEETAEAGEVEKEKKMHQCSECGKSYKHKHKLKHHKTWLCKERALGQVQSEPRRELSSNFFHLPTIPEGEEDFGGTIASERVSKPSDQGECAGTIASERVSKPSDQGECAGTIASERVSKPQDEDGEAGAFICCDQCQEYFPSKSAAKNHRRKYCNKVVEVISLCDICCSEHC